jgi:hypothetical protein
MLCEIRYGYGIAYQIRYCIARLHSSSCLFVPVSRCACQYISAKLNPRCACQYISAKLNPRCACQYISAKLKPCLCLSLGVHVRASTTSEALCPYPCPSVPMSASRALPGCLASDCIHALYPRAVMSQERKQL